VIALRFTRRLSMLWASLVWALMALITPAAAQPDSLFLEDLTWTELRTAIATGKTTIIVPIGGTEQSGPHLALGKHNARVRILAERIARALGNAVVAPVIAYVPEGDLHPPSGHMRFPGTITVSDDVFQRVLESAAQSFKLHGFRDIAFLGDHGSTQTAQKTVAARLNREWQAAAIRAHAVPEYYRASTLGFRDLLKTRGYRVDDLGNHGGLLDTSLTLALAPGLVRSYAPRDADRIPGIGTGIDGDPGRASAELGRLGVDLVVARTVEAIKAATTHR
jgi:creatinine amidohydrolase